MCLLCPVLFRIQPGIYFLLRFSSFGITVGFLLLLIEVTLILMVTHVRASGLNLVVLTRMLLMKFWIT